MSASDVGCRECGVYVPTQYATLCDSCMDDDSRSEGSLVRCASPNKASLSLGGTS